MITHFEDHCWKDLMDEGAVQIYKYYERELKIGNRPAILAIDLYNLVFLGGSFPVNEIVDEHPSSCGMYAWQAIEPIKELLALGRAHGMPIIYTTADTITGQAAANVQATYHQEHDKPDDAFAIKDDFTPEPGDLIIYKLRASAFFGTALISYLQKLKVDSLIVCGESTSGCVRASVVDSYSYGFHTVVAEECCFDRYLLTHKINLFDMHHKYADVMRLADIKSKVQAAQSAMNQR